MPDLSHIRPLAGLRVITLAPNVPGPVAARRLLALGAEVIKIEPPDGDPMSAYSTAWYEALNAGQRRITLDLKADSDRQALDQLLETTDLLLTSSRPASLEHLGLDWEGLHRRFPRLCMVRIVGHPPPDEGVSGHDLTYQAEAGLLPGPRPPRTLIADLGGAELTVSTAMALLLARERGGPAACGTVALAETAEVFAEPLRFGMTRTDAVLGGGLPEYSVYACAEGHVAVACLEPRFRECLRQQLGLQRLTHRALAEAFAARTAADWESWARERDLPLAALR